ncbi:cytochrome c [Haloferula helveola]|uniref:Cytochrome c n=1 Tax=Haloferula helveola TaxID=490095 RepID=A0ABM7RDK8_9BACT|nr:cytochrome c [Haloferula helveola]
MSEESVSESPEKAAAPVEEPPKGGSKAGAVFFTIVGLATIAGLIAMPLIAGEPAEGALSQWQRFLGRFHPLVLHLPIGMLVLVLALEFGKLFRKDKGASTIVPAFFTAASSVVAVIFGFLLWQSNPGDYPEELVNDHLWWGTGFAAMMVAAFVIKGWVDVAGGAGNWLYFVTLLGSGVVMGVASHDGGSITHGKSYLTDEAPNEVRELYNKVVPEEEQLEMLPEEGGEGAGGGAVDPGIPVEEQIVYTHLVQPIFDQKCVSCHGAEKQKGKFRMDTYELLVKGGKEGEGIEPGNAEDSSIMFRVHLPEDDDEHMPPEGKKQLEAHEIEIIEWWIDSGASPDVKVVDAEMPEPIKLATEKLVPPEVLAAQAKAAEAAAAAEAAERAKLAEVVEKVREEFPSALNFESQESSDLTFTAVSMRKNFTDEHLAKLQPVVGSLVSLDLSGTTVTDEGLRSLAGAEKLRMLRLSETGVTDAGLDAVAGMVELESLNLYGTAVTKDGVMKISELPKLRKLYLWQTQVDAAGADEIRKKMPECEIVLGIEIGGGE